MVGCDTGISDVAVTAGPLRPLLTANLIHCGQGWQRVSANTSVSRLATRQVLQKRNSVLKRFLKIK